MKGPLSSDGRGVVHSVVASPAVSSSSHPWEAVRRLVLTGRNALAPVAPCGAHQALIRAVAGSIAGPSLDPGSRNWRLTFRRRRAAGHRRAPPQYPGNAVHRRRSSRLVPNNTGRHRLPPTSSAPHRLWETDSTSPGYLFSSPIAGTGFQRRCPLGRKDCQPRIFAPLPEKARRPPATGQRYSPCLQQVSDLHDERQHQDDQDDHADMP